MQLRVLRLLGAALTVLLLASCATDSEDGVVEPTATTPPSTATSGPSATEPAEPMSPTVTGTIATGLDAPWGLDFLPDGDALVTQRDRGAVVRVSPGGEVTVLGEVPGSTSGGEGGLLGIAVSPDFETDQAVFVYTTSAEDNRVLRMRLLDDELTDPEVVVDGIAKANVHNGGRIAFGPDGMLHVATGDAGDVDSAQDLDSLNGKILRMTPDGDPAADNPFGTLVHSYGHRNVQGLAWDDAGQLYASEFGQNTWDELNLVEPGGNYGWPVVEGRADDDGGEFVPPIAQWSTDEASPSGITVVDGTVLMAALRGERLWAVPVDGGAAGEPVDHLVGEHGRLRTVAAAPDGSVWLITSNTDGRGDVRPGDDRILRLTY